LLDALWWIGVIATGVALGIVIGDWLRRGLPVSLAVYQGFWISFVVVYVGFLYFVWQIGWIPQVLLWIRSLGPE